MLTLCYGKITLLYSSSSQVLDTVPFSRRADPAIKENGLVFVVSDENEERVISIKGLPGWCRHYIAHSPTGSNCLSAIFIHLHKGFMDNFRQVQTGMWRDSSKISLLFIKNIHDAHVLENRVEIIAVFQDELGKGDSYSFF